MNTLVSIIIPVYNAEKYLAECIESALNQTWPNKEIIIVDDGSTDNSLKIAKRFENRDVTVFSQNNNGASAARNTGLKEAKGDYIQFLDADDILGSDKIESQIQCLNGSLTHLGLCKTVHFFDGEDFNKETVAADWFCNDHNDPYDFLLKLYAGNETMPGYGGMIQPGAWLTPRALVEKAGPWNEDLSVDDDGEFFCRVLLASGGVKFSNTGLNYYRKFKNRPSLSAQKSRKGLESAVLAIDLKFGYLKAKKNDPLINSIFARNYWWTGVLAYPKLKDLSKYCIQKAKELGYEGEKYVGGPAGHLLTSVLGWKAARLISSYRELLKKSWA